MKKLIYTICILFSLGINLAQQASDYFPTTCARWEYKVTPLDSLNNEIDSLYYFRHDYFFDETYFEGKLAKIFKTKSGPEETIYYQPYLDSMFFHFSGPNVYEYFKLGLVQHLFGFIDSLITDTTFSILDFFKSQEDWYSVYRFNQNLGDDYTIWQIDTSIVFDTLALPIRLKVIGERLEDDSISTQIGDLDCKKFVRTLGLSYLLILPPPLPPIEVPILSLEDYIWIAEDYWIVQGVIPSINVDLSFINLPSFYIPGLITKIDDFFPLSCTSLAENEAYFPEEITLKQNYPNPFNPSTTIEFSVLKPGYATLKVYNSIGEEVAVLLDQELNAGIHKIEWNAGSLPSGVYFYKLNTKGTIETKKMILIK